MSNEELRIAEANLMAEIEPLAARVEEADATEEEIRRLMDLELELGFLKAQTC